MATDQSTYGSDQHGLVCAYLFSPGVPAQEVATDELPRWLAPQESGDERTFLWLHFSLANAASVRWLRRNLAMPDSFYESLNDPASSTRLEVDRDSFGW